MVLEVQVINFSGLAVGNLLTVEGLLVFMMGVVLGLAAAGCTYLSYTRIGSSAHWAVCFASVRGLQVEVLPQGGRLAQALNREGDVLAPAPPAIRERRPSKWCNSGGSAPA